MSTPEALHFDHLREDYFARWHSCVVLERELAEVDRIAAFLIAHQERYEAVANKLVAVPWFFIGALHNLESSLSWNRHLHNGDPLRARTVQVPAGRPATGQPPYTWQESAWDALHLKALHKWQQWDIAGILFQAEKYNGWGYRLYHPSVPSPYLWAGSNHETPGKYVADNQWDPRAQSAQIGVGTLLRRMVNTHQLALRGQRITSA